MPFMMKDPLSTEVLQYLTKSTIPLLSLIKAVNMFEDIHLDTESYLQMWTKLHMHEESSHFKCEFISKNITPERV